ncbi:chromatin-remodeling ATPase INO80 isoform X2 [Bradysia coprophila]|uniref:chromatin-remodeling ATPase INO80 isoform X2 n=1 Tax=Bradysia coprophila TaxID=38358 RepID=UPI00187D94FB|nr:chromatin-remodeling ATPase INO80 isoform X2 [Bradysia coprophila]
MAEATITMNQNTFQKSAEPLHIQRLEACLDLGPFMKYAQDILSRPLTSSDDSDSDVNPEILGPGDRVMNGVVSSQSGRRNDKSVMYNFTNVGNDRKWLQDLLLSDTDSDENVSDEDEYIKTMLKDHVKEQKYRRKYYTNANNAQYGYYGTGLLSNFDSFYEHRRSIVGTKKRKYKKSDKTKLSKKKLQKLKNEMMEDGDLDGADIDWDDLSMLKDDDGFDSKPHSPGGGPSKRGRKKQALLKTPEVLAARRRKIWQLMAKKELGKVQRAKANNHKEVLTSCKRYATMCMKVSRQKAMMSQKNMKETVWRAKRLTREMQGYWKRYDRVERETRRRMEKEAEEQRKHDVELIEAKRQQRKLNFLITQTELYAHFMSKKLGLGTEEEQLRILNQLDEEAHPRLAAIDDYNSDRMKQIAQKNAAEAFNMERQRTKEFDLLANYQPNPEPIKKEEELPQPNIFAGNLKGYQIKGMTWLANLYDQGISGILADEMGLGKTVQSIAFLCHIAENYGVWGPFLIISPASTLHNWQQEMQRFVPDFKVIPYWGSPNERKILRQFWEPKDLHTKDASFHVVITSYQLIVSDYKYFNRLKWQYMILDEAQAIKSSSSVRWKMLLGFNCRNRLLLSGTPIQNSMAELWALLHFIMPTLFDSHDEFNEWFSKDIESHAENKTGIDEKQISRLHMILKPFMLRRIKKDVENELSDKIEIMVYCPLTTRQKLLYMALKRKIRIEDLLQFTDRTSEGHGQIMDKNFTSSLMNLVMQFRKVCNHPELFERRDAKSPLYLPYIEYVVPKLVYDECLLVRAMPSKRHLLFNKFSIYNANTIHRSLTPHHADDSSVEYTRHVDLNIGNGFSFTRFCDISPHEFEKFSIDGLIFMLQRCEHLFRLLLLLAYRSQWWQGSTKCLSSLLLEATLKKNLALQSSPTVKGLLFTKMVPSHQSVYTFTQHTVNSMAETVEHRIIRSKHARQSELIVEVRNELSVDDFTPKKQLSPSKPSSSKMDTSPKSTHQSTLLPAFHHIPRLQRKFECQPTTMPNFLYGIGPKVTTRGVRQYTASRSAAWTAIRHEQCENPIGQELVRDGLDVCRPHCGWSNISVPDKQTLISDAGKLTVLDALLTRLKAQNHRVLIYSQMTKVIDLLEEYMWHRKHRYHRLDGSSKISARRDMVADFQNRSDIFVFLLSTRAGGLGINLTAADTVIFYDSDWNPTVDQQAMDRAHRLGQTKQVTVYRLICKGTIEERILQRAREKSEIQRMVISGGNFKPDTLKPKEVVSLLLDDEEIELKYRQRNEERKSITGDDQPKVEKEKDKKRKPVASTSRSSLEASKKIKLEDADDFPFTETASGMASPAHSDASHESNKFVPEPVVGHDESSNEALIVDCDSPSDHDAPASFSYDMLGKSRRRHPPRGAKRGRPRGSRRGGGTGSLGRSDTSAKGSIGGLAQPGDNISIPPAIPQAKRGPGRPRLKPNGPGNQGQRTPVRIRKPIGPLVVPLGSSPAPTPPGRSPAMSPAPSIHERGLGFYQSTDDELFKDEPIVMKQEFY